MVKPQSMCVLVLSLSSLISSMLSPSSQPHMPPLTCHILLCERFHPLSFPGNENPYTHLQIHRVGGLLPFRLPCLPWPGLIFLPPLMLFLQ